MKQPILLSAHEVLAGQKRKACIVVDCRFVLNDPDSGYKDYLKTHIPGAIYAHLDNDLSSPVTSVVSCSKWRLRAPQKIQVNR